MIRLFLNGVAASAGGGLTYLRNVLPHFSLHDDVHTTVALDESFQEHLQGLPNVEFIKFKKTRSVAGRFLQEQKWLPGEIQKNHADVLISAGNFALKHSPVPQILLARNALYTSKTFLRDIQSRRHYRLWAETHVRRYFAKRSIQWADCTLAPSQAFADELQNWTRRKVG